MYAESRREWIVTLNNSTNYVKRGEIRYPGHQVFPSLFFKITDLLSVTASSYRPFLFRNMVRKNTYVCTERAYKERVAKAVLLAEDPSVF